MYVRLEHEVEIASLSYNKALQLTDKSLTDSQLDFVSTIKPHFDDELKKKKRVAGAIKLVSITPDNFTGIWWITDGNSHRDRAYEDMLAQLGIPKTSDYRSYNFYQHIAAGSRIDDSRYAITSLFRADVIDGLTTSQIFPTGQDLGNIPILNPDSETVVSGDYEYKEFVRRANEAPLLGTPVRDRLQALEDAAIELYA